MHSFSSPFAKAFRTSYPGPFASAPLSTDSFSTNPMPDGFVLAGRGGALTEESLAIVPYCDGPAGTLFSMRLYYWNPIGVSPHNMIAVPLMEVLCSVSNACGIAGSPLLDSDRLCDQITLTAGNLGYSGTIYSFGAGTDLVAMVNVEIQGARLLSFDFQTVDANGQPIPNVCNMNALWAKFS